MKKFTIVLLVLFVGFNLFAQKGISFQGIAPDAQGNAITGESITVKFTIGSFAETQTLETDDFGVFSATIGSVNTNDFNELVFANNDDNLKVEVDGQTIYDDKFNTVPYAKAAENGVPVGCIMPFAGAVTSGGGLEEPMPGWIVCNGATLSTDSKFDKLKNVLGGAWGTNHVPDLRGVFLRGLNNGRPGPYIDTDASSRSSINSGNSGDKVGSFQGDIFKSHKHSGETTENGSHHHGIGTRGYHDGDDYDGADGSGDSGIHTHYSGDHTHTLLIDNTGGAETRPKNAAVNFIIKY